MRRHHLVFVITLVLMGLTGCNGEATPRPTATETPSITIPPSNTQTPTQDHSKNRAVLLEQDFLNGPIDNLSIESGHWDTVVDETGNHMFCNTPSDSYSVVRMGDSQWTDYAVEYRAQALEHQKDPYIEIDARIGDDFSWYDGAINFETHLADLSLNTPYRSLGHGFFQTQDRTWYWLRLEVAGTHIKFFLDDQLFAESNDSSLKSGRAGFSASPQTRICFDNILVWALTPDGRAAPTPTQTLTRTPAPTRTRTLSPTITNTSTQTPTPVPIAISHVEVITDQAATGDGGNSWGGHQTRIVRTSEGVFTAFTTNGSGPYSRIWHLVWRRTDGTWAELASGDAGKDPVNLLASPDGTLHIIGWPRGVGSIWSGKPVAGQLIMTRSAIPGVAPGNWPYSSAGIDEEGDLCVLSSVGGQTPGGKFQWACFQPAKNAWTSHTTILDFKFCYSYLFPNQDGSLMIISTRDVRWSALGYDQPEGVFDYVFNAFGIWRTNDFASGRLQRVFQVEEPPTPEYPYVYLNAQQDAYVDTRGIIHVLYHISGRSTNGVDISRQAIFSPDGQLIQDVPLPPGLGYYARIFQDTAGRFYLLGSMGRLYPAGSDGITYGPWITVPLSGYEVEYSGFGISAPRTGTPISRFLDVVFPTAGGTKWIYFQLTLP